MKPDWQVLYKLADTSEWRWRKSNTSHVRYLVGGLWQEPVQLVMVYAEYDNEIDGSAIMFDVHCHCALVNRTLVVDKRSLCFAEVKPHVADEQYRLHLSICTSKLHFL